MFTKKDIITYLSVIISTLFVLFFIVQLAIVSGNSMNPTLEDKDILLVSRIHKTFSLDYNRFDVVIFQSEQENNRLLIKRVIGLPGETIHIKDGDIYINDEKIEENYGKEHMTYDGLAETPITLKENEYFVLGDNRNNSKDSRYLGPINKKTILGKAIIDFSKFKKL